MSIPDGPTLPLKVMINKQKSKVLFAEVNSDVVDVLMSFLTLPLGRMVRILEKHYSSEAPVIGSLTTLYRGLSNLDSSHFCAAGAKKMMLNPRSSFQDECCTCRLNLDISAQREKVYYCEDSNCPNSVASNVSLHSDIAKCVCGKPLNLEIVVEEDVDDADMGVFMTKSASYIICDDFRVVAVDSGFLQTLNYLGITDGAEMSILSIDGIGDIMDLFKNSLVSATPLTDLVNKKTQKSSTATKLEAVGFLHDSHNGDANSRKMSLKILLQKSTNKFLLAVASDEFVEFLFSLLAIPLGGVEYLLGGNTCLKNIDNLYKSVTDVIDNKCFMSSEAKSGLMNPKLAHGYVSKNQFLPLIEENPPNITVGGVLVPSFKSSKGQGNLIIKEQTMYIVSDDLTVTPFSITSTISIPSDLGIVLSDVTEKHFQIGLKEALSILKTSLSSTTVLTDALINPMLNKLPKRPKIKR